MEILFFGATRAREAGGEFSLPWSEGISEGGVFWRSRSFDWNFWYISVA